MLQLLDRYFRIREHRSNFRTEIFAGITTFLTGAYIIFVNPAILAQAGMNQQAVFAATCIVAAIGTLIMGIYAKYPVMVAPVMGSNAYFTYTVVQKLGYSWEIALMAVFVSGILFLLLTVLKIRQWIIDGIPYSLKIAVGAGIGLFLAVIGLKQAGIIVANPATLVALGHFKQTSVLLCLFGFCLIAALDYRKIPGAILIGIIVTTIIGMILGNISFHSIISLPPSLSPTLGALSFKSIFNLGVAAVILTFFFTAFFDSTGTLIAIANQLGLLSKDGKVQGLNRALQTDSAATIIGSLLGTATVGAYIESSAGIQNGGRTGLTAVVTAVLFLLALMLSPLASIIPTYATAAALLYVACLMMRNLIEVNWQNVSESAPAVITLIAIPLTFSITEGISLGVISYVVVGVIAGNFKKLKPIIVIIAALCLIYLLTS